MCSNIMIAYYTHRHATSTDLLPDSAISTVDITGTRWRRLIGSPKLQIIFHKRATKYRSLLRKMTYKDKGSYESSPPCNIYMHNVTRVCMCIHKFIIILQLHTNIYGAGWCGCDECGYFNY